jgi:hypothetical protein
MFVAFKTLVLEYCVKIMIIRFKKKQSLLYAVKLGETLKAKSASEIYLAEYIKNQINKFVYFYLCN